MTPEHKKKIATTLASQKEKRAGQTIVINGKWKIERSDDYNWVIIRKGHEKEPWFFGKLLDALLALPHKILDEQQMRSLADILKSVKETAETIERLRFVKLEHLKDDLEGA